MAQRLDDKIVKALPSPATGNQITYDLETKGFGVRVTANGAKAFILNYRTKAGRERRFTIGAFPTWKTAVARDSAKDLKIKIAGAVAYDPLGALEIEREAPTVADLCARFEEEQKDKLRPRTWAGYKADIDDAILPALKHKKVAEVTEDDADRLHRSITRTGTSKSRKGGKAPYRANRVAALGLRLFNLAIRWKMRTDNPFKGLERNAETQRRRYLSIDELGALTSALADYKDQQAANIVRLLLLTGARRGEVLAARWADFDLRNGVWTKPGATTKQKTEHSAPLSEPARQLLEELREGAQGNAEFVFPGRTGPHRIEIKRAWKELCIAAGIVTKEVKKDRKGREIILLKPSARIHDLRHSFASYLVSSGVSLPIVGALLGHTQAQTTLRYAHSMLDAQREATQVAGAFIAAAKKPPAQIVDLDAVRG